MLEDSYVQITVRKLKQNKTIQNQNTYTVFLLKNKQSSIEKKKKKTLRWGTAWRTGLCGRNGASPREREQSTEAMGYDWTDAVHSDPQVQPLFLH